MLSWLSDPSTLEIPGRVERVNAALLRHVVEAEDSVLVFFCGDSDRDLEDVMGELETVDDNLESEAVEFVWCPERGAIDGYGLKAWPSLVLFRRGVPVVFAGNLQVSGRGLGKKII